MKIKDKFELLLPRNDQLASFIALEELMQANAYGSDQIAATRKRVVQSWSTTCNQKSSDSATESLFAHYVEHELKFVLRAHKKSRSKSGNNNIDADDRLNSLLGRYDLTTDGPGADLLWYNNCYLQPKNTQIAFKWSNRTEVVHTWSVHHKIGKERRQRKYDVENVEKIIYRFEQNIVDGLTRFRKHGFHEFLGLRTSRTIQSLPW